METPKEKQTFRDVFLRTIAVLGLIAILLLGAWGIIQLAISLPNIFGNIGGSITSLFTHDKTETISVTSASTIASGQTLQISWDHQNMDGEYSYTMSYACQDGLSLKAPLPTGAYQTIACNTPFNFVNATTRMTVVPTVTGSKTLPLAVTISATKLSSGVITTSGSATTNISPSATPTTSKPTTEKPTTSTPGTTYYPAPHVNALYGYADLAVRITSAVPNGSRVTVQFVIENTGTNSLPGGWVFNANLPINGGYTFTSQPQRALFPGDKIAYTMTYENPGYGYTYGQYDPYNGSSYTGQGSYTCNGYTCTYNSYPNYPTYQGGTVTITVDPWNTVIELSKANNSASATVRSW